MNHYEVNKMLPIDVLAFFSSWRYGSGALNTSKMSIGICCIATPLDDAQALARRV